MLDKHVKIESWAQINNKGYCCPYCNKHIKTSLLRSFIAKINGLKGKMTSKQARLNALKRWNKKEDNK